MDIKLKAYIFIACSLIGGALFPVALKVAAVSSVSLFAFIFMVYLIATPAALVFVAARGKLPKLKSYMKNPKEYLMLGIIGFTNLAFVDYALLYAEKFVSASLATVIYRMQPLLMLLFIPILLREKVSKIQIVALMLAFAGIYIAFSGGSLSIFSGANTGLVLFLVVMTLISAFSTVFMKRYTTDMESTMFIFNSVALVISAALFLYTGAQIPVLNVSSTIALLYVGIVVGVAVPFFYYSAFRVLKTTFVTNLYCLSPFITVLFSGLLLGETIYPYYIVIAVLVAIGILIQRFDRKGGAYVAKIESRATIYDVSAAFVTSESRIVHDFIKGNGRVLAIRLKKIHAHRIRSLEAHESGVVYTNNDEQFVDRPQASFISEIVGKADDELVLMFAGDPKAGESYLVDVDQKAAESAQSAKHDV